MKRIQSACLEQTNLLETREEYNQYLSRLKHRKTVYQVVSETEREDGGILVRIRKQYLQYDIGDYFDRKE